MQHYRIYQKKGNMLHAILIACTPDGTILKDTLTKQTHAIMVSDNYEDKGVTDEEFITTAYL